MSRVDDAFKEALQKFGSSGWKSNPLTSIFGSWLGLNLSPADIQGAQLQNEYNIEADERKFQYDIRAAKEIPSAQVEGYAAAGLNPALMYQGAPSVPAQQGTAPSVDNTAPQGLGSVLGPMLELAQIKSIIDERRSNIEVNKNRAELIGKQAEGQGYQNQISRESINELIALNKRQPELLDQKINALREQAETDDEKQKLMVLQQARQQLDNEQFGRMMDLVYQAQQMENQILSAQTEYQAKLYSAQLREINKRISYMTSQINYTDEAKKYLKDKTWQQVLGGIIHDLLAGKTPKVDESVISTEYDESLDNTD